VFLKSGDTVVSPWHDVPLHADAAKGLLNFICEIPKDTKAKARPPPRRAATQRLAQGATRDAAAHPSRARRVRRTRRAPARAHARPQMEVATDEANTPIKQDTKKGKLRDYP